MLSLKVMEPTFAVGAMVTPLKTSLLKFAYPSGVLIPEVTLGVPTVLYPSSVPETE